jgi:ADP-heptose:LPS heptosyltransferase
LKKVLIVLPRQLGDILLGLAIAKSLRDEWKNEVEIHWYAHPMGKLILEGHPWVNAVHYYPQGFWKELKFIAALRSLKFDIVIDAMANPRTAIATFLSGAPTRISFPTRWNRNWAYNQLVGPNIINKGYVGQQRLALLAPLGINIESQDGIPKLFAKRVEAEKVHEWLRTEGLTDTKWVALSPTHRHGVRKWPGKKFVELARLILQSNNCHVVWLWGPGELEEVRELHDIVVSGLQASGNQPERTHLVPLFNLRETAELCSAAQLFVGNSNGLSHVAAAGGCKTLVLHGPTSPVSWTPSDSNRHRGIQRNTGCVGCEKNVCQLERRECLEDLEVNEVFQVAARFFSSLKT